MPTASTHESWVTPPELDRAAASKRPAPHVPVARQGRERIEDEQTLLSAELLERQGYRHRGAIGGWCGTTFGIFDVGFEHVDVSNTQNHLALIAEAAFTNHLLAAAFLDNPPGRMLLPELRARLVHARRRGDHAARPSGYMREAAVRRAPFFLTVVYHVTTCPTARPIRTTRSTPTRQYRGRNRYRIDFQIDEMIQRGFDHDLSE